MAEVTFWETLDHSTSALVNITIVAAASFAIYKFRVFRQLSLRWKSELECRRYKLESGEVVFTVDLGISVNEEREPGTK
jgi:hypothetical protein